MVASPSPPFVSVIIPAYNDEEGVRRCLASVLASDYENYEVIVVDDGSADRTAQVAASFPGVKVVAQANGGAGAAKNLGAAHARGEWLYFLDCDVVIPPDNITRYVRNALEHRVDLVHCRYDVEPLNNTLAAHYKALTDSVLYIPSDKMGRAIRNAQMNGGGELYAAAAFRALGGFKTCFPGASVEREELWIRFYEAGYESVGDTRMTTRHAFPGFGKLLRNYASRIYHTVAITAGKKPPFTYISLEKSILSPIAATLCALATFASLCGFVSWLWAGLLLAAWLWFNRSFLRLGLRHKGLAMTLKMLAPHFLFGVVICVAGTVSKLLVRLRKPRFA